MLCIEIGSVGYNFKMKIKVGITKKGTLEPVLGGKCHEESGLGSRPGAV